jgi:hypothetical protein
MLKVCEASYKVEHGAGAKERGAMNTCEMPPGGASTLEDGFSDRKLPTFCGEKVKAGQQRSGT